MPSRAPGTKADGASATALSLRDDGATGQACGSVVRWGSRAVPSIETVVRFSHTATRLLGRRAESSPSPLAAAASEGYSRPNRTPREGRHVEGGHRQACVGSPIPRSPEFPLCGVALFIELTRGHAQLERCEDRSFAITFTHPSLLQGRSVDRRPGRGRFHDPGRRRPPRRHLRRCGRSSFWRRRVPHRRSVQQRERPSTSRFSVRRRRSPRAVAPWSGSKAPPTSHDRPPRRTASSESTSSKGRPRSRSARTWPQPARSKAPLTSPKWALTARLRTLGSPPATARTARRS